jgi:hypothetical protein
MRLKHGVKLMESLTATAKVYNEVISKNNPPPVTECSWQSLCPICRCPNGLELEHVGTCFLIWECIECGFKVEKDSLT